MARLVCLLAAGGLSALAGVAHAVTFDRETQALPCRPTIACTADLVPPGAFELEVGYLFRQLQNAHQHSAPFLVKLTLAEWAQLQVSGNGPTFTDGPIPTRYVDDLELGFKFHLADQTRRRPSLSWSVLVSVPLDQATGYLRTIDLLYTAYLTKDFGWLHADVNLGLNLWRLDGPLRVQPWVSLALSVALGRHVTLMGENYWFGPADPVAAQDGGFLAAVAVAPWPFWVIDAGADVGYFQSRRPYSLFVGMTLVPVDFWQTRAERARHPHER